MNNLYEVSNKLENISIDTERICNFLQLAAEETDEVSCGKLYINNKNDVVRALCYANRAPMIAALIDTSLMTLQETVEELNRISAELLEQSRAQKQAQQQTV